jgi:sec-independent protein translocase protein TatA
MLIPSVPQLGIIAVIVALICGTRRLREFGGDLGGMFRGIREGFKEAKAASDELAPEVRALKDDVRAVTRTVTDGRIPYVRMSDGSNDRSNDSRYVEVEHDYFDRNLP